MMRNIFSKPGKQDKKSLNDSHKGELVDDHTKLNEKLQESEIRYRRLFESAKDGILILDFEYGQITDANPFIVNIIDHPFREIIGKELWEIGLFSNKDESELAYLELKEKGYIRFEDMPIPRQNGKITEVEFVSNVYLVGDKKVIQCNIRDITERKKSEKALLESEQSLKRQNAEYLALNNQHTILNKELTESINHIQSINNELNIARIKAEESDRLKSAFLTNLSHEIRTPMNAIVGFSSLLAESELTRDIFCNYVQIINASSQQLLSIINDVIEISKIETDQMTTVSELVNVNDLLNELFNTYIKIVDQSKFKLNCLVDNSNRDIQIKTDGNKVKQIVCNLLNNAIKFTIRGNIDFGYNVKDNFIEFFVRDTGIGIAPENQELIFHRFRKVIGNNTSLFGGNGLGLSISKALVEKLGGKIKVTSEFGVGSTFTFTIPFIKEFENKVTTEFKKDIDYDSWNNKTILLVEDDSNSHHFIEELFSITNIKIINAWDGKEALDCIKKFPEISLVLMDIKMPGMDGYITTSLIKQIRPELPIIAQTAYALTDDRKKALNAGCDDYISKPINRDILFRMVNNYLSD